MSDKEPCFICKNEKGKITKEYCHSNPLSKHFDKDPLYKPDGGDDNCRNFIKINLKGSMFDRWRIDEESGNPIPLEPYEGHLEEKYDNGNLKAEGYCKNGKQVGKWTYYNEDGSLLRIETYENGVKESEDILRDGKFWGKSIRWYENGVKKGEGDFIGDEIKKLGKWTWWYDNGNKKSEGRYDLEAKKGSVKEGLWIYYNEDGSKKETIEYNYGQEYICSECDNKKGEITKNYCTSNPLSQNYNEEPEWEDDGGWEISKMHGCRDFCKANHIPYF